MAMKRCKNGHFFDDTKHSVCPFCGVQNIDVSKTIPMREQRPAPGVGGADKTVAKAAPPPIEKTVAKSSAAANDGKTVGIMRGRMGFDPVVGWLVCIDGPDKGKDYRLKSEKNFIGRGANMDIAIQSDTGISRSNHAIVSFNPMKNTFMLQPGDGHGLVYLNDEEVYAATRLSKGDTISLGNSKLMFIPFCGECYEWQKD